MKRTANMSVGNPMALQMMPLQKSTLGQSFLSMKQGSERAMRSSSTAISINSSFPVISKTSSAIFFTIFALGSQFLQTLCPNPQSSPFLFLTSSINWGIFDFLPICSSILRTASLAPPCLGPQRAPVAPAMEVQMSTPEEERCRTAAVEQLSSCSAWRMKRISRARTSLGCGLKLSSLSLSSMKRKFSTQPAFSWGLLYSRPMRWRQALAAMVGTPPRSLQICLLRTFLFLQTVSPTSEGFCSGCRVERAATALQSIPMGCASYLKEFIMVSRSSWRKVCSITFLEKDPSSFWVGSSPQMMRKATSRKLHFSASTSMGYPLYSRIPLSPSMQEMLEVQVIVFMYPGSYPLSTLPLCVSLERSPDLRNPRLALSSWLLPVRESMMVTVFFSVICSAMKLKRFIESYYI